MTPAEALAHPTWDMGLVVTTNSATLVNKGLEVIEAHLLFDIDYDRIDVVVHPQSIVHSMVEFVDGSTIAQASPPDMRLPISLGLDWPHRGRRRKPLDWTTAQQWTFEPLDDDAFPPSAWPSRSAARAATRPSSTPRTSRRWRACRAHRAPTSSTPSRESSTTRRARDAHGRLAGRRRTLGADDGDLRIARKRDRPRRIIRSQPAARHAPKPLR